jgi:hypothetical protein
VSDFNGGFADKIPVIVDVTEVGVGFLLVECHVGI